MKNIFHAGIYRQQDGYASFLPNDINTPFAWDDPQINILLERATLKLGSLDTFSDFIQIGRAHV